MPLLQLPDAVLLAVLQCCAAEPASWASAARAHSKLHQAAVLALNSITADVQVEQQLESLLLYLERHGQHVDSIHLTGNETCDHHSEVVNPTPLSRLPDSLQLRSLRCSRLRLQACEDLPQGVVQAGAPLVELDLRSWLLLHDDRHGQDVLAAALAELPALEHLCIDNCCVWHDGEEYACTLDLFKHLQQLTCLDVRAWLDRCRADGDDLPAQPKLSALTRLVDLQLLVDGDECVTADMLASVCRLTRLELAGFADFDGRVLVGKTLLQHLHIGRVMKDDARFLSQLLPHLQDLQQLTHLFLRGSLSADDEGNPPLAAFSTLAASSKLQHLGISWCFVPAGAWQHMFPVGRQLPQLRSLDLLYMKWTLGKYPGGTEGNRLVSCCPGLRSVTLHSWRVDEQLFELLGVLHGQSGLCVTGMEDVWAAHMGYTHALG